MINLKYVFHEKQKVKIKIDEFYEIKYYNGIVKEVYKDYIIVTNTELGIDGYYEEGFNLDCIIIAPTLTIYLVN